MSIRHTVRRAFDALGSEHLTHLRSMQEATSGSLAVANKRIFPWSSLKLASRF